jgi:hypothetical protein
MGGEPQDVGLGYREALGLGCSGLYISVTD